MIRMLVLAASAATMTFGACVANAATTAKPIHKPHPMHTAHQMVKKHTASKQVAKKHVAANHVSKNHLATVHGTGKACKGTYMYSKGGKCMDARQKTA